MSDVRIARNLISVVELAGVRLTEMHARHRLSAMKEIPPATIKVSHKASASAGDEPGGFVVLASIDVQVNAEAEEGQPLVRIRAKLELRYKVPSSFAVVRKDLNAFARVNAIYNAWPYFREIVQSVTGRMDLPQLILPVYRISRPKPPSAQPASPRGMPEAKEAKDSQTASSLTN